MYLPGLRSAVASGPPLVLLGDDRMPAARRRARVVMDQRLHEGRHRHRSPGLRQGHAQAHPGSHRRPDLRPDGPLPDANGKPTNDESAAAINPTTKKPVENGLRNMWVNETALTTALNTAYFAEQVATFAIVMGVALLLAGLGFGVLTLRVLVPEENRETRSVKADKSAVATA